MQAGGQDFWGRRSCDYLFIGIMDKKMEATILGYIGFR